MVFLGFRIPKIDLFDYGPKGPNLRFNSFRATFFRKIAEHFARLLNTFGANDVYINTPYIDSF